MDDFGKLLDDVHRDIEQRVYRDGNIDLETALFLLGGTVFVATGLRGERDRLHAELADALCDSQSAEGALHDAEDERDRLRAVTIDALGYGADYLVAVLCTSRSVDAQFAREFADNVEEMAKDVTGVTEYEKGSLDRVGDALRDAREILSRLDRSDVIGGDPS